MAIKSGKMRCFGNIVSIENKRDTNKILVRKSKAKRPLKKPRSRCEDAVGMNVKGA
jgi:hypothetical protein